MNDLFRLVRWLTAKDDFETAVLYCPHVERPKVGRHDLVIRWICCLQNVDARQLAILLANGCGELQVAECPQANLPLSDWQAVLGDRVSNYRPVRRLGRGQAIDLANVPFPRRQLFAPSRGGSKTLQELAYESFHKLVERQAIPLPEGFAGDRLHAIRCLTCSSHAKLCDVSWRSDEEWLDSCLACRVAVHYCALFAGYDTKAKDEASLRLLQTFEQEMSDEQVPCTVCKNMHPASEGEICALCEWREKNPFAAGMPANVLAQLPKEIREKLN